MKISRAAAWGIVIADVIVISLLIPHFYDSRLLFLQLFVVVLILWRSLWVAMPASEEKSLPNWLTVRIGTPEIRLNRAIAVAWGIVIADAIVIVLGSNIFEFWMLFLQFFVVVAIVWKSLWMVKLNHEEKSLTNWQAVKIGIIVGLAPIALALLIFRDTFYGVIFTGLFVVAGMPVCILGAFIGKKQKNTPEATWGSAIVSSILAFTIVGFLMTSTCMFGC